jgi:hypothetical protein
MSVRTPLFTGAIFAIGLAAGCGLATAIVAARRGERWLVLG